MCRKWCCRLCRWGGGNLSHFSADSCVSESGQVAVEFCMGCQGKCFHVDLLILLFSFLLSHQALSGSAAGLGIR